MPVAERLNKYILHKDISLYSFENEIGSSRGAISKAIKESKNIGSHVLENILNTYPDLNPEWLLTGDGDMLREEFQSVAETPAVYHATSREGKVPLYNIDAYAGVQSLDFSNKEYIESYVTAPFTQLGDLAIHAQGNSMYPSIWPGDILIIREVAHWQEWLSFGKAYIIATDDQLMIKIIRRGKVNPDKYYNIYSINQEYDDFELPREHITKVMMVVGIIGNREN